MYRPTIICLAFLVAVPGTAVSDDEQGADATRDMSVPAVTFTPDGISYRIIGTPVVGQPVTVDLRVESAVDDTPVTLSYATNDSTAMTFPETQQKSMALAFDDDTREVAQQVTVVPMREGRLFLNVAAKMQTDTGSVQTVTAIPLQVGAAPRQLEKNGAVTTDANGELIRDMPASEN
jgi:hypothetical protein